GGDDRPIVREERSLERAGERSRREERGERAGQAREARRERAAQQAEDQDSTAPEAIAEEAGRKLHEHVRVEERGGEQAGPPGRLAASALRRPRPMRGRRAPRRGDAARAPPSPRSRAGRAGGAPALAPER